MTTTVRTEAGPRSAAPVALLSVSSALVGALSYACSLVLAHLLMPADFAEFAAAAALVGTAGVASAALVPLPLATRVRAHAAGTVGRTDAVTFAAVVALVAGLALAALLAAVTAAFAGGDTVLAVAASALALVTIAPVWGVLQGEARFSAYATLTVVEVAVRLGVSAVAAVAGAGAAGALWGYVAGAAVVLLVAGAGPARQLSHDLRRWAGVLAERARWAEVGSVAAVQVVLAAMMSADAVVVAALAAAPGADTVAAAGYQAVATLAKAPIYLAVASALVSFPALRAAPPNARAGLTVAALRSFASMLVPAVAVVATLPAAWALLVLPAGYAGALTLLPWLALAGAGLAAVTVAAMLLLANGRHGALTAGLAVAVSALSAGLAVGAWAGPSGVAVGTAVGALAGAAVLLVAGRATFAAALPRVRPLVAALLLAVAMTGCLALLRPYPLVWTLVAALLGAFVVGLPVAAGRARARVDSALGTGVHVLRPAAPRPRPRHRCTAPGIGLHVLHLGFEDPAMPGSGGGSLRTHEIGARLAAAGHRVTVLTTRFPGAQDRSERHGTGSLTWIHIGLGSGTSRMSRLLGYVAAAPVYVRAVAADLVVEDFCAPFSSMGVPWWSTRPTVGVVQWLNAREKAREYHVPVHLVERLGVRSHRSLIAMSQGVAERLHAMAPRAQVRVIGNGVDPVAATVSARTDGVDIVFVGRLEIAQKGLDLLLDAWATACEEVEGDLVIVGTGPDEAALRSQAERLGVAGRVRFAGRIDGRPKFELLAAARLVAMPSRFETFGIVAAEALAVGTPVLAFDIDCLREVVPTDCGVLVPLSGDHALDVEAYSAELVALHRDTARLDQAVLCGPLAAEPHNWTVLARTQETVYRAAVQAAR